MSQTQFQDIDQSCQMEICQMEIWKEENEENGQLIWKIIATRISYYLCSHKGKKVYVKVSQLGS